MEDEKLRRNVSETLDLDSRIDASDIFVTARDGVVTLTGQVQTYSEKYAAGNIVAHIAGVKGVAQELEVCAGQLRRRTRRRCAEQHWLERVHFRLQDAGNRRPNAPVDLERAEPQRHPGHGD